MAWNRCRISGTSTKGVEYLMSKWMYKGILSVELHADRELTDKEVEDMTWLIATNDYKRNDIEIIGYMTASVDFLGEKMTDDDCVVPKDRGTICKCGHGEYDHNNRLTHGAEYDINGEATGKYVAIWTRTYCRESGCNCKDFQKVMQND